MKALPMLDHAMLWVARVSGIIMGLMLTCSVWFGLHDPNVPKDLDKGVLLYYPLTIFSFVGLWFLRHFFIRLYVGFFAVMAIFCSVIALTDQVPPQRQGNSEEYLMAGLAFGFASMLWACFRAPQNSTPSPNPVNLVNPV